MYDENVLRMPCNEPELWDILREQFSHAADDFARPVETKKDAVEERYHRDQKGNVRRDRLRAIRYRHVGDELDSRGHFLKMGRELLPYISEALDHEKLTPAFVQQWGKLMFCHGYVASHILDDSDGMANHRGGHARGRQVSKEAQKRWVAHLMFRLMEDGRQRSKLEEEVVEYINGIIDGEKLPTGFERAWFTDILDKERASLRTTYDEKRLGKRVVIELAQEAPEGLPPVPEKLP